MPVKQTIGEANSITCIHTFASYNSFSRSAAKRTATSIDFRNIMMIKSGKSYGVLKKQKLRKIKLLKYQTNEE